MADFMAGAGNGQGKLRVSCARKQERYQRLLGPCKKYTADQGNLQVQKNTDCNGLEQINWDPQVLIILKEGKLIDYHGILLGNQIITPKIDKREKNQTLSFLHNLNFKRHKQLERVSSLQTEYQIINAREMTDFDHHHSAIPNKMDLGYNHLWMLQSLGER